MRRKTLVPASQEPAGFTKEVPTLGQAPRSDPDVGSAPQPSKEPATSMSPRISNHNSGFSPDEYILRRSLERALNLLKQESVTVTTVYHDAGFDTETQFIQTFCGMTGITPSIYREKVQIAINLAAGRRGLR